MPTIRLGNALVTYSNRYRLPLRDGTHVFMEWHSYCGPTFYRDRLCQREIVYWWQDPRLIEALGWFTNRGCRA